jgi:hypothetical protein
VAFPENLNQRPLPMKTRPDDSTVARRFAYGLQINGQHKAAQTIARYADKLEAKEPQAWQPAGFTPITQLLKK